MLVPLVALAYDIQFASRSDQVVFLDKEHRLGALVKSIGAEYNLKLKDAASTGSEVNPAVLHSTFSQVAAPYVPANSGIRFGLYVPQTEKITVLGFLHNYRKLSPQAEAEREKEILESTKNALVGTEVSRAPIFRIAGTADDQVVEYISPVMVKGKVVAVMWAGERLNPIFTQSSYFRKVVRYFILVILVLGVVSTLWIVRKITTSVDKLKSGLTRMEKNIDQLLPDMGGEMGQVAAAVNKMAVGLSEKEKLEDQLRQSEHLIALGRLATGVAHELRNPIGIIKTLVELMQQEYSQVSGIDEFTKAIDEQVDRQNMVIQELLDFGRPTKGIIKECSINQLITGVLSFSAALLRKQRIKVNLDFQRPLPRIPVDAEKLKQVFVNLIINAIEAMPKGGQLVISTGYSVANIVIKFTDTGEGIPLAEQPHIFDPFYTTKKTGTGLGLSISYQSIKLHNGIIDVQSEPGQGTEFTIKLPVEQNITGGGGGVDTKNSGG